MSVVLCGRERGGECWPWTQSSDGLNQQTMHDFSQLWVIPCSLLLCVFFSVDAVSQSKMELMESTQHTVVPKPRKEVPDAAIETSPLSKIT